MPPGDRGPEGEKIADRAKDPTRLSGPSVRDPRRSYLADQYPAFVRNARLRAADRTRLREEASGFGYRPLVSLLLTVTGPEVGRLWKTLDSVIDQVYPDWELDRKSTRLNSSHANISYAVFCLKKKKEQSL